MSSIRITCPIFFLVFQVVLFSGLFCGIGLVSPVCAQNEKPNVVIILADDLGYGDVHALNKQSSIPTPNIDRLDREGLTFTDAHTPSAVCTPTRYGLLTGRYCWRTRLKRGVLNGYSSPLIDTKRKTLATVMKSSGYQTGIVGKWHLGLGFGKQDDGKTFDFAEPVEPNPNNYGFDFSHIIPASLDFPPYVYIQNGRITAEPTIAQSAIKFPGYLRKGERSPDLVMEDCLDDLLEKAVHFIDDSAGGEKPFFLYFPLTAPHKPVLPHSRFRGKSGKGVYGDFVMQVDSIVGGVLDALDKKKITDNTMVIFTSDNGSFMHRLDDIEAMDHVDDEGIQAFRADRHRSNHIYRGTKADIWEAGHRVPFFVRWPGKVSAGATDQSIGLVDVLATCAELTGVDLDAATGEDSFSFLSTLLTGKPSRSRPPLVHHSASGMFAIREGPWKLVLGNGSGGREKPSGKPFGKPYQLYNLASDPRETKNVAAEHPDVVDRLENMLEGMRNAG